MVSRTNKITQVQNNISMFSHQALINNNESQDEHSLVNIKNQDQVYRNKIIPTENNIRMSNDNDDLRTDGIMPVRKDVETRNSIDGNTYERNQISQSILETRVNDQSTLHVKIGQNTPQKSAVMDQTYAEFDFAQGKSVGDFFANARSKAEKTCDENNFLNTQKMKGQDFVKSLIEQQQERYQKKFAFERGVYHQCIPNPQKENQMITVQLVTRALSGLDDQDKYPATNFPQSDLYNHEEVKKEIKNVSQKFQRLCLGMPSAEVDNKDGSGEGEDEEKLEQKIVEEEEQKSQSMDNSKEEFKDKVLNQDEQGLYHFNNMNERVDPITGIAPEHYADAIRVDKPEQEKAAKVYMDCKEFAVIAFWDLSQEDDTFNCSRFFIAPNPMRRTVQDCEQTQLEQILYPSHHNNEVFLFFRGYEQLSSDDLLGATDDQEYKLQIAILDMQLDQDQPSASTNIIDHCRCITIDEKCILAEFIQYLDTTKYQDQHQVPNPTIIKTPKSENSSEQSLTVVFTAYMKENYESKEAMEQRHSNGVEKDFWYPTIYFFELEKQKVIWEIFGAEQFIEIGKEDMVGVLTNQIWTQVDKEEKEQLEEGDNFSRHNEYENYIWAMKWKSKCRFINEERDNRAPKYIDKESWKLTFGSNKTLEITENFKIIEAYRHNKNHITLIYKGLGAFSFITLKAKNLAEENMWHLSQGETDYRVQLQYNRNTRKLDGYGQDENKKEIYVKVDLEKTNKQDWLGHYLREDGQKPQQVILQSLDINEKRHEFTGQWINLDDEDKDTSFEIKGKIDLANKYTKQKITFNLEEASGKIKHFKGYINLTHSRITGSWSYENETKRRRFELNLGKQKVEGDIQIYYVKDKKPSKVIIKDVRIFINLKTLEIQAQEEEINLQLYALEAVDTAELTYFILESDVNFIRTKANGEEKERAFVQSKLKALQEDDDINSNGKGVAESKLVLYDVSEKPVKKSKNKFATKIRNVREPIKRIYIKFYLNQSYLRCQEKKEIQLWNVNPSIINSSQRLLGSIIYEDYSTDDLCLNFFTAQVYEKIEKVEDDQDEDSEEDKRTIDYPQSPVTQSWIVDYPLMAYKTFTPTNNEIAIIHMAQDIPQRLIDLGEWEFVCFVNHTQMVEQKLFGKDKETNCDIMFLVKRQRKVRLMSFKSNPWLSGMDLKKSEPFVDKDVYRQALFLFSGKLRQIPDEDESNSNIDETSENLKKFCRRFSSDKIQSVQLITYKMGSIDQYMMIMQFNDCIVKNSLNKKKFEIICQPEAMLRRHLVRGYNEKIFYAESQGSSEKIIQLQFDTSRRNEVSTKEIWQLTGSWLVAFEADAMNIQNDTEEDVIQSLFVMDDLQRIYLLKNEDNIRFVVKKVIDFSHHMKMQEISSLRDNDWQHVFMTERTLTFNQRTYNLSNVLSSDIRVPDSYFGEQKIRENENTESEDENEDLSKSKNVDEENAESDDDSFQGDVEEEPDWNIQSVQNMSMTTNMIAQCQKDHKEFCFMVKPAPGSRKLNIVGFQQLHELEQMLFVSNFHVLLKFRGGKAVTLLSNGCIIHQTNRVQKYLEQNSFVQGESQIYRGKKTVLLQQNYGIDQNKQKRRMVAVQFNSQGKAEVAGIFDQYRNKMYATMKKFASEIPNQVHSQQKTDDIKKQGNGRIDIKFAKEFFITPQGEVIKMAAIVTKDNSIRTRLQAQCTIYKAKLKQIDKDSIKSINTFMKKKQNKKIKLKKDQKERQKLAYISIYSIDNNIDDGEDKSKYEQQDQTKCEFKVIVFHCYDTEDQNRFVSATQFCVVGNWLCYRVRKDQVIWALELRDKAEDFIIETQKLQPKKFDCKRLDISKLVDQKDLEHIQLTEVPKAYFTTIKTRIGRDLEFYDNLIQVTVRSNGIIYDLDTLKEVQCIEQIDQLSNPDYAINTGFIMSVSTTNYWEDEPVIRRIQMFTNENVNLHFEKKQDRYQDGTIEKSISGMLYRTFSEIDLQQLHQIQQAIDQRQKLNEIDTETIMSVYEGHTIFSIFFDRINVYEQILSQLQEMDFQAEEDIQGQDTENTYLRRLYRVLSLPTGDLRHFKSNEKKEHLMRMGTGFQVQPDEQQIDRKIIPLSGKDKQDQIESKKWYQKVLDWIKVKMGIPLEVQVNAEIGFKSIQRKSIHFKSARFRESLMEIGMMCQENSLSDFVENQLDIKVLFYSMSPAIAAFLQDGFSETRYTKKVKNLDWKIGKNLQVLGKPGSVITQKEANRNILGKQKADESDKIQNRQVQVKMLDIGWIFSSIGSEQKPSFRELIATLSKSPHESVFSTDLVITLVQKFQNRYYWQIFYHCFIPYVVYFVITAFFFTFFTARSLYYFDPWEQVVAVIMGLIIILLDFYFLFYEVYGALRDGKEYLLDVFNYVDVGTSILNLYLVIHTLTETRIEEAMKKASTEQILDSEIDNSQICNVTALAMFFMWIKAFYWMRLFSQFSNYVRLIRATLWDIKFFVILYFFILLTFANALIILNTGRLESKKLYDDIFSFRVLDAFFNIYLLSLGEFATDNFEGKQKDVMAWFIFFASTFITQITFLNMLIAVMSDTYDQVKEIETQSALKETIQLMADYAIAVNPSKEESVDMSRFIFAITPKALGSDEQASWEGTVTSIKRYIHQSSESMQKILGRRIGVISNGVSSVSTRLNSLDDKMNDLSGNVQKLSMQFTNLQDGLRKEFKKNEKQDKYQSGIETSALQVLNSVQSNTVVAQQSKKNKREYDNCEPDEISGLQEIIAIQQDQISSLTKKVESLPAIIMQGFRQIQSENLKVKGDVGQPPRPEAFSDQKQTPQEVSFNFTPSRPQTAVLPQIQSVQTIPANSGTSLEDIPFEAGNLGSPGQRFRRKQPQIFVEESKDNLVVVEIDEDSKKLAPMISKKSLAFSDFSAAQDSKTEFKF